MNLALKYRPNNFNTLIGQQKVKQVLENQIKNNDVKQGYLFSGPAGTGKTTTARIMADKVNNGRVSSSALVEIDGASNNGVDNIRNLIDNASFKPMNSEYKVYIIDEAHMLSKGAFNALLKILEEPPEHVIFILATTEPDKIIPTILSRLQRFDFKPVNVDDIAKHLENICKKENVKYDLDSLKYIAKKCNGGVRDSILTMETCMSYESLELNVVKRVLGVFDKQKLNKFILSYLDDEITIEERLQIVSNIDTENYSHFNFLDQLTDYLIDICYAKAIGDIRTYSQINKEDVNVFKHYSFKQLSELNDNLMEFFHENYYSSNLGKLFKSWCLK